MIYDEPDKLSQDAAAARAANMSYGKWKGLHPQVNTVKHEPPKEYKICEYSKCGKPYIPTCARPQKYCSAFCCTAASRERSREKRIRAAEANSEETVWENQTNT